MSNKIKRNESTNTENKESAGLKGLDKQSIGILSFLGVVFLALLGFIIYVGVSNSQNQLSVIKEALKVVAPDFSTMEAVPSTEEENTEKVEGTIGYDAFYELRKAEARENLDKVRGFIGDTLYVDYLNGLDSDYFKQATEYDYNDILNSMDDMLKEAGIIEALYNYYALSNTMPEYTKCSEEDCSLLAFIEDYTRDDLHDYLKERHDMWESVLLVEKENTEVADSYLKLYYQDEVLNDLNYLDKIQVEYMVLNKETFELGSYAIQDAYDKGYIETTIIDENRKDYLKNLSLYKDIDYYDGTFKDLTIETFQSIFVNDVLSDSVYLGSGDVGDVNNENEDLISQLKGMGATASNAEEKDYNAIENWMVESFSLANRNEEDVIYVLWNVVPGSVEHSLQIPAQSEMSEELMDKSKLYIANKKISDTIYAELNGLNEQEVHDLLIDNYGYTEDELDEMTEEELRESLQKEEEKESLANAGLEDSEESVEPLESVASTEETLESDAEDVTSESVQSEQSVEDTME